LSLSKSLIEESKRGRKVLQNVGIVGFGAYIPANRLPVKEVAEFWGKEPKNIEKSLGVIEKAIPDEDEDAVTMGVEAGLAALKMGKVPPEKLEAIYVGSESHPYAVNPSATIIGEALGVGRNYLAADLEFACKAATAGMENLAGLLEAGLINCGIPYPSHQGRFSGKPAYFVHVTSAAKKLLEKNKMKPADFSYCVFHMPNGKFPLEAALTLGFEKKQLEPGLIVGQIGNPYSASSLLGLCSVLEVAKPNDLIFLTSYGSGAGADSFILKTTKLLNTARKRVSGIKEYLNNRREISYSKYLRLTNKIL